MKGKTEIIGQRIERMSYRLLQTALAFCFCSILGCTQSGLLTTQESAPIESRDRDRDPSVARTPPPPQTPSPAIQESVVNVSPLAEDGVGAPIPLEENDIIERAESGTQVEKINKPAQSTSATQQLLGDAQAAFVKGDLVAAESVTNRGLRIAPKDPALWLQLAKIRLGQGEYLEAVSLSERAQVLASNNPAAKIDALEIIATAYDAVGEPEKASQARQQIRDLSAELGTF